MFKVPTFLPYPKIKNLVDRPEIGGIFCYVIKAYEPGYSILVRIDKNEAAFVFGNWNGEPYRAKIDQKLFNVANGLRDILKLIGVPQAQFFFADGGLLVDVQVSLNKFLGPGMVRDIFNKQHPVQEIYEIATMTPDKINDVIIKHKSAILKPSRWRFVNDDGQINPLYARLG